jgi:hypothetical protein
MHLLLSHSPKRLVPFLCLGDFAGLRSQESMRLDWKDLRFDQDFIEVSAAKSKTASRRLVPILPNLKDWLLPLRKETGRVLEYAHNAALVRARVHFCAQGIKINGEVVPFRWKPNALRHSYAPERFQRRFADDSRAHPPRLPPFPGGRAAPTAPARALQSAHTGPPAAHAQPRSPEGVDTPAIHGAPAAPLAQVRRAGRRRRRSTECSCCDSDGFMSRRARGMREYRVAHSPATQKRWPSPRKNRRPAAATGEATMRSPRTFSLSISNFSPTRATKTVPSSRAA